MLQDQCISVTDLRTNTKECLSGLTTEPKYVFVNNKPVAVLLNINEYENLTRTDLIEIPQSEVSANLLKKAEEARKFKRADLINIT